MMRRSKIEACKADLAHYLESYLLPCLCADSACGVRQQDTGSKVWVLPQWYYRWLVGEREALLAGTDFLSTLVSWPRLHLVGDVAVPAHGTATRSGTRRTIGKGTVGAALFVPKDHFAASMVHDANESNRIGILPRREFAKISKSRRLGMRRSDFIRLSNKYGSTVVVSLSPPERAHDGTIFRLPPLGVLTIHSNAGTAWTPDQIFEISTWAVSAADDCVARIIASGYEIPASARRFTTTQ